MSRSLFASNIVEEFRTVALAVCAAGAAQAMVLWWMGWRGPVVLLTPALWMTMVVCGISAARGCSDYLLAHPKIERKLSRKIAIIGHDENAARVAARLTSRTRNSVHIIGIFADSQDLAAPAMNNGTVSDLIAMSRVSAVDAVIIALPPGSGDAPELAMLVQRLRSVAADVFVVPYLMRGANILLPTQSIGPMSFTVLQRRPLNETQLLCKSLFDFVLCAIAVVPLSVCFLFIALVIKLDSPGPAFFLQPRLGLNNRQFTIFKFRSMYVDQTDLLAVRQTSRKDPRVTRVGKWLRRLSIDEMPQIFNVLRGEMSIVGPRPHAPQTRIEGELLDDMLVDYIMRYQVKPGITGWAQVNGARGQLVNSKDLRKRVGYDLDYMRRWSLAFDLKIIGLTLFREIFSKNAY
jgi:exopolysaccharide biosynthesis polyprenyl glycosylphosphotransferase